MRFYKSPPVEDGDNSGEHDKDNGEHVVTVGTSKLDTGLARIAETVDGAIGVALVDLDGGLTLGTAGGEQLDLDIAAAGGLGVVRAQARMIEQLEQADEVEDILITTGNQYHLIRRINGSDTLFLYLAIERDQGNLGLARHQLRSIEADLDL